VADAVKRPDAAEADVEAGKANKAPAPFSIGAFEPQGQGLGAILLQRRELLRRQRHARHQMEILRHSGAVVHQILILLHHIPSINRGPAGQFQNLLAHQPLLVEPIAQAFMHL